MSVPDPVTTGVVLAGALQVAKQGQEFIAAALGHKGESIGTVLGSTVERRRKNAESVASKAYLTLLNIGVSTAEIPLNILQPALEAASLQDDDSIQDKWANLLANAGDPRQRSPVEPCYQAILKELSSREVRFLDRVIERSNGLILNLNLAGLQMEFCNAGLSRNPANIPMPPAQDAIAGEDLRSFQLMMDIIVRHEILVKSDQTLHGVYIFTRLGRAFVQTCRKPQA